MPQVTHFNEEALVSHLRAALRLLQAHGIRVLCHTVGETVNVVEDALRDLDQQFPEISVKDKKFLDVIRATQPELMSHAKELIRWNKDDALPVHLAAVNNAYTLYLSTLTHWGV